MDSKLTKALNDPTSIFNEPEDVISADFFTREQKREVLTRWEADSRELQVATEEGMIGGETPMLQRVRNALRTIDADEPAASPTKQGG